LNGLRAWLAIALLAASFAGAAAEPIESSLPGQRPPAGSDEDELWYAMERSERELQQSPLLVRDPALNAYVREVACKVAADYCQDLRVYIVDLPWFNASMSPNGMLIVWTGALLRVQDEAELALVLGHEFAHFRERHTLQAWRKAKRTSAFLATFGLLTYGGGVGIVGQLAGIAGAASMFRFSRTAEREADRLGFASATAQGYDPEAGVRIWERLKHEEDARHYGKPIPVFATHPQVEERLEDVRAAATTALALPGARSERNQPAYRAVTRPFLAHWLEGELSRRMYDTSIQVLGELRALAPADAQATYAFYQAEAFRRRAKGDDRAQAERLYAEAVRLGDPPAAAWREHGLALRARGERAAAASALQCYLRLEPAAADAAFIRRYLTELEATP
jgi:predicted Zn-dependent protease